jgi:ABC-type thiamin/hydroxymethylpyrimidine transport system permease subunit
VLMDIAFGSPAFFLLLTGGLGASVGNALARRDGPSALAMMVATVGTSHLAELPVPLLVWGCTALMAALTMSLIALLRRCIDDSDAFRTGTIGTMVMALLLIAHQEGALPSAAAHFGDQSLAVGSQLHLQIEILLRD